MAIQMKCLEISSLCSIIYFVNSVASFRKRKLTLACHTVNFSEKKYVDEEIRNVEARDLLCEIMSC